ncbi:MAG: hypothetical protein ROZ37_01385 [Aromatoleum sp.]|jgi:ATP-dependent protease ClpP protease subunit|uniref:COG3904 family protein n=1 Tax=Aromatoleum sp. TaxID=2307007 RepID=UPI0028944284|nr:hypothetical protein [Aromatoleum sp.]MDT3668966.1 hypothetical protein [Aromatoleum sp.]
MKTIFAALFGLLIITGSTWAADFRFGTNHEIVMEGRIEEGDIQKLLAGIAGNPVRAATSTRFVVNSLGGSVSEGLTIASFVHKLGYTVLVQEKCASSCFFIYAAAQSRALNDQARVGIHSIYSASPAFAGLSPAEAKKQYTQTEQAVREFLRRHSVPTAIQDRLFATSSTDIHWLTESELDLVGDELPHIRELTIARCGSEQDFLARVRALDRTAPSFETEGEALLNSYQECILSVGLADRVKVIDRVLKVAKIENKAWSTYLQAPYAGERYAVKRN